MKKLLLLSVFLCLVASVFASEIEKAPKQPQAGKINARVGINTQTRNTRNSETPSYEFHKLPTAVQTTFYDYMIGSYNSNPIRVIEEQPSTVYDPTKVYMIWHGQNSPTANRRTFYSFVKEDGTISNPETVSGANVWEGYAGFDIDPVTKSPMAAWHLRYDDANEKFNVVTTYDQYSIGSSGIWRDAFTVMDHENPSAAMSAALPNTEDHFNWPYVFISESSPVEGKRRVYITSNNNNTVTSATNPDANPSENVLLAYADVDDEFLYTAGGIDTWDWQYRTIPQFDQWHDGSYAGEDTNGDGTVDDSDYSGWMRPFKTMVVKDNVVAYIGTRTGNADFGWGKDDEDLFVLYNTNYGEGDFTLYTAEGDLSFEGLTPYPEYLNPETNEMTPFFDDAADLRVGPTFEGHHNAVIMPSGKIKTFMNYFMGSTKISSGDDVYYPMLGCTKMVTFDPTTGEFSTEDVYPSSNRVAQQNDGIPTKFWDIDEDGELDTNENDQYITDGSIPIHYMNGDAEDNKAFHENNQKVVTNAAGTLMAAVWQDCTKSYDFRENDDADLTAWENVPEVMIAVARKEGRLWAWSAPIRLNSIDTPEFADIIPAYVYPGDIIEDLGVDGQGNPTGRLHLMFLDDNSYGSSIQEIGATDGGQVMYASLDISWNYVDSNDDTAVAPVKASVLEQNFPNPFNPTTTMNFTLPKAAKGSLKVYNVKGQLVKTLNNGRFAAGKNTFTWHGKDNNGNGVASGVYFYKLETENINEMKKMLLVK